MLQFIQLLSRVSLCSSQTNSHSGPRTIGLPAKVNRFAQYDSHRALIVEPLTSGYRSLAVSVRVHLHPAQHLGQFNPASVDAALHRAFRNLEKIDYLLVRQLLDVPKNDALAQIM